GILRDMGDVGRHRGPDDAGVFVDGPLGLSMQRLSIIDVAGGMQPIFNEDRSVVVVCNGEIYNFRALRNELRERGHHFASASDVEVIVHLYESFGLEFVHRLEGMFAFALWDRRRQRLVLGRDRLGIKPLYVAHSAERVAFASEAKSLFCVPGLSRRVNRRALPEYLNLGYVPAPLSMYDGVQKLPPATLRVFERDAVNDHCYWSPPRPDEGTDSAIDWAETIRTTLFDSVQRQMISDVPVGAFLSGGLDSSAVVAAMSEASGDPVRTFAIGFGEDSGGAFYNELPFAREVAARFATHHREIVVTPSMIDRLPRLVWHMDEPIADSALVTTYLVAQFAREDVKVILSGVGGDELFGGYRRYLGGHYAAALGRLPRWLRRGALAPVVNRMPSDRHSRFSNATRYARAMLRASDWSPARRYQSFVEAASALGVSQLLAMPGETDALVERTYEAIGHGDELDRMTRTDLVTQLPDDLLALTDRMSMAASLECRVPLLDEALVNLALKMPSSQKIRGRELKVGLKAALADTLPPRILNRAKRGFGAPMGAWFRRELRPFIDRLLSTDAVAARGWLKPDAVQTLRDDHDASRADHTDALMSLVNLELWAQTCLDGQDIDHLQDDMQRLVAA
ncbi:MAG: asparagine synthase (glutamine-hydrolyzing), partial [Pseudomonadota bacterium]